MQKDLLKKKCGPNKDNKDLIYVNNYKVSSMLLSCKQQLIFSQEKRISYFFSI